MLITLKQKEIESALRLYVTTQGINLASKNIEIQFTAGRKEAGISAEVEIIDAGAPVEVAPLNPFKITNEVVGTAVDGAAHTADKTVVTLAVVTAPPASPVFINQVNEEVVEVVAPVRTATSLFS